MITTNGEEKITEHSYYTSLVGLFEDNKEDLNVSLAKLQRVKFPYTHSDFYKEWTIRKGSARSAQEVRDYNKALNQIEPEDFE